MQDAIPPNVGVQIVATFPPGSRRDARAVGAVIAALVAAASELGERGIGVTVSWTARDAADRARA